MNGEKRGAVCAWGLFFALVLCLFSIGQKALIHADPWAPKGFIVPVFFGGGMGLLLGKYIRQKRILTRQLSLRVRELEELNGKLCTLESLLPICMHCKRVRLPEVPPSGEKAWVQLEEYITERTRSSFSHGVCPDCLKTLYKDLNL